MKAKLIFAGTAQVRAGEGDFVDAKDEFAFDSRRVEFKSKQRAVLVMSSKRAAVAVDGNPLGTYDHSFEFEGKVLDMTEIEYQGTRVLDVAESKPAAVDITAETAKRPSAARLVKPENAATVSSVKPEAVKKPEPSLDFRVKQDLKVKSDKE